MKTKIIIMFVIIAIPVGYYLLSPFFINIYLNEIVPEMIVTTEKIDDISTKPTLIIGTKLHPASGTVRVISSDEKNYLRYENFKTINGPDIYVYLSKDMDAKEYINLGKVKATEGNINYDIPTDIDPREYPYALVWCKAFGVLFNFAKLY